MDELSPAVHLEPSPPTGKGWGWRGWAGAGLGGLQGSPGTLLGSGGSRQSSSGSRDTPMAAHPPGLQGHVQPCELQQLLGKALSFCKEKILENNHVG